MELPLNDWYNGTETTERKRSDGTSWKDFWLEKAEKKSFGKCSVDGCDETAEVGAHVGNMSEAKMQNNGKYKVKYRIVPMCAKCNKLEGKFKIKTEVKYPLEELE